MWYLPVSTATPTKVNKKLKKTLNFSFPLLLTNVPLPPAHFRQIAIMKKWIVEISSLLLALLFIYAATSKLLDYRNFVGELKESPLSKFASIVAWLTPTVEILLSIALLIPKTRKAALYSSFLLMMGFTIYIIYILKYSPDIPCSCGGILESMNWTQHLIFNIAFTALALTAIILSGSSPAKKAPRIRIRLVHGSMGLLVVLLIAGALSVSAIGITKPPSIKPGARMPTFSFLLPDGKTKMSTSNIPTDKPIVLTYFTPTCSHCQEELVQLYQKKDSIAGVRFYYITSAPWQQVERLSTLLKLNKNPYVTLGSDTARHFYNSFKPTGTPYHIIYTHDKQLYYIIPMEASPDVLMGVIKKLEAR